MKEHKYLYQKMLNEVNIRKAYKKLRKGKTKRKEIRYIDEHLDEEVFKMKMMIANTRPGEVECPDLAFKPIIHKPRFIREGGKDRRIYMPEIHEQWLHHIIILVLEPIVLGTAHPNSCGSYPRRGPHYGKRRIEKWIRSKRGISYYMKIDIRHFYDNISYKILFRELRNRIKDEWMLYVIQKCLGQFKKGLPLGFYISQWLSNFILEPVDKMIAKISNKNMRYMDDIVVFDSSVFTLRTLLNKISRMLGYRFYLRVKGNYQVIKFDDRRGCGRPLDFMGFVFFRNKTIMRKSIMLKATSLAKKIRKILDCGYRIYRKWISGLLSYNGWFKHTDSYNCYLRHIKPYVRIGHLKQIISSMDRKEQYDRMERNKIFAAA